MLTDTQTDISTVDSESFFRYRFFLGGWQVISWVDNSYCFPSYYVFILNLPFLEYSVEHYGYEKSFEHLNTRMINNGIFFFVLSYLFWSMEWNTHRVKKDWVL